MGEIRRFYIDFLHRPLEEYQKFTAYTSPGVGVAWRFGVMLRCDGHDCSIEWFHLQCVGLSRTATTEKWLCPHCKDKGTHTATCS